MNQICRELENDGPGMLAIVLIWCAGVCFGMAVPGLYGMLVQLVL